MDEKWQLNEACTIKMIYKRQRHNLSKLIMKGENEEKI